MWLKLSFGGVMNLEQWIVMLNIKPRLSITQNNLWLYKYKIIIMWLFEIITV